MVRSSGAIRGEIIRDHVLGELFVELLKVRPALVLALADVLFTATGLSLERPGSSTPFLLVISRVVAPLLAHSAFKN